MKHSLAWRNPSTTVLWKSIYSSLCKVLRKWKRDHGSIK